MILLLDEVQANTTGTQDTFSFTPQDYNDGKGAVYCFGTFDTCTVTLEFSPDNGTTWVTVDSDTTFTAAGWSNFEIHGKVLLRGSVSSVGASTSVSLGIL